MPKTSRRKPWSQKVQRDAYEAFQDLYDALSDAYWAANTMEIKDRIRGIADVVFDILTELNRQKIKARTQEFTKLAKSVRDVMPRLEKVKEEIDEIIQAVKIATKVVEAAGKVIKFATEYLL